VKPKKLGITTPRSTAMAPIKQVWGIAYIGQGTHAACAKGDRRKRAGERPHQLTSVTTGEVDCPSTHRLEPSS